MNIKSLLIGSAAALVAVSGARAAQALDLARNFGGSGPFSTISYPNFKYNWNQTRKENGFSDDPHMVPHILRHTCASRLVQAGIDLRRVQTFLGHQTIQMTLRYAHLATNDLDQCAIALDAANMAAVTKSQSRANSSHSQQTNGFKQAPKAAAEKGEAGTKRPGADAMPAGN